MKKYTVMESFRTSEYQKKILKQMKIKRCPFIRDAINEKLEREKLIIP